MPHEIVFAGGTAGSLLLPVLKRHDGEWPDIATDLEHQLSRDPEDDETRVRLLTYYFHNNPRQQRVESVCWLIEHHPESPILSLDTTWIFENGKVAGEHYSQALNNVADYQRVHSLWESAVTLNPNEPEVLHNAARFCGMTSPIEARASSWQNAYSKSIRSTTPERWQVSLPGRRTPRIGSFPKRAMGARGTMPSTSCTHPARRVSMQQDARLYKPIESVPQSHLRLCGWRLPELNLIPIQVIDPGEAAVRFIHSLVVDFHSLVL